MRKVLGYTLAFIAGTVMASGVAYAGTSYVQAQRYSSTIYINGNKVASPPMLVYGGSAYVQLYSIQQGLKGAGFNPTWNGSQFSFTTFTNTQPLSGMSPADFSKVINGITAQITPNLTALADLGSRTDSQAAFTVTNAESTFKSLFNQVVNLNVTDAIQMNMNDDLAAYLQTLIDMSEATSKYITDENAGNYIDASTDSSAIQYLATIASSQMDAFNSDTDNANAINPINIQKHSKNLW